MKIISRFTKREKRDKFRSYLKWFVIVTVIVIRLRCEWSDGVWR